jgi:DNA-binding NtrC family response regulator
VHDVGERFRVEAHREHGDRQHAEHRELAAVERVYIAQALSQTEQNRSRAADLLGVKRTTLVEKIKRLERLGLGDGLQ